MKLLAARSGLKAFDLLLGAAAHSPRTERIAEQMARCADGFLGAVLHDWADIDPASAADDPTGWRLQRMVQRLLHRPPAAPAAAYRTHNEPAAMQAAY